MKVLITGGAGYIGSHMARMYIKNKTDVVVLDTLERGHQKAVPPKAEFYTGNVSDRDLLNKIFSEHHIDGVLHFAGYIQVGESVDNPDMYFRNNVIYPLTLLTTMEEHKVQPFIFSSTAAVYGNPVSDPIPENHTKLPESPYGLSKWNFEELLQYYDRRGTIRSVSLRYFNAAGADETGNHGEDHVPESHIIPLAFATALGKQKNFTLYGNDYQTKDGTCIRDYIHVEDLCSAHMKAMEGLWSNGKTDSFNIGTGKGISNREIIRCVQKISGAEFEVEETGRRAGDPGSLVADPSKIMKTYGWKPEYSELDRIIQGAWKWHTSHPNGYSYEDRN